MPEETASDPLPAYRDRIQDSLPALTITSLQVDCDGLMNDVMIANQELVFRFPKNDQARQALAKEIRILDLVRLYVDLPVPQVEHQEDDWMMYRLILGRGLHREDILRQDETTQERLAEQVAVFLQQLHSIPGEEIERHALNAPAGVRGLEDWTQLYQEVQIQLFPLLMTHAREWVGGHFSPLLDGSLDLDFVPAFIHGDLGPYHFLYDPEERCLRGVIDFGSAGLGDPADDFANVIHGLGEGFLRKMLKYIPVNQAVLDRSRFHAGTLELQWAVNGLRSNDLTWLLSHIGRARDVSPIGNP
jgi:aminoglycoside 2''-phosphotransferase